MERKAFKFESKVDLDKNTFEGYAAAFNNVDSHNDIIEPGAFSKTLREYARRVKVLWQHDPYSPIGKPNHMEEDSTGLYIRAKISQTTTGKDALILMKDGVIDELSIGYNTIKHMMNEETGIRHLKELRLMEFSPVTWASNDQAIITGAKQSMELQAMLKSITDIKNDDVNPKLINEAIKALKALLIEVEPDNSTHKRDKEPLYNEKEFNSILKEMQEFKKTLGGI